MDKVPQYFQNVNQIEPSTDRALFRVPGNDGEDFEILVECVAGTGNVPRRAASLASLTVLPDFGRQIDAAAAIARVVIDAMKQLAPGAIEVQFGLELGGTTKIPLITQGHAKANFQITLAWNSEQSKQ